MPVNEETGEKYSSPEEALADALPEGVDASEVMDKLKKMQYDLVPASGSVGVAIEMETSEAPEEMPEEEASEEMPEEEASEEGGLSLLGGAVEMPEPMAKKRGKVAESLMDKFKKGMV